MHIHTYSIIVHVYIYSPTTWVQSHAEETCSNCCHPGRWIDPGEGPLALRSYTIGHFFWDYDYVFGMKLLRYCCACCVQEAAGLGKDNPEFPGNKEPQLHLF